MTFEEDLDQSGRDEANRKTARYRCDRCGTVEVLVTRGEEPECTRCGNRLTPEP